MEFLGDILFADEGSWLTLTTDSDDPVTVTVSISASPQGRETRSFILTPISGVVRMPAGEILRSLITGGGSAVSGIFTATQGQDSCTHLFRVLPCRKFEYDNLYTAMLTTRPVKSPVYGGAADRISFYNNGSTQAYVRFLHKDGSSSTDYALSLTVPGTTPEISDIDVSRDTMLEMAAGKGLSETDIAGYKVWLECSGAKSKTYLFDIRQSRLPLKTYKFLGTRGTYEYIHATGKFSRSVDSETTVFVTSGSEQELENDSAMGFEQGSGHIGGAGMGKFWLDFLASRERYIVESDGSEKPIIVDEHKTSLTDLTKGDLTFKWHYADKDGETAERLSIALTGLSVTGPESTRGVGSTVKFGVLYSPKDTTERGVLWTIAQGAEYARIDRTGRLTVLKTDGTPVVKVVATSETNPQISASKSVQILESTDPLIEFDEDAIEIPATAGVIENGFSAYNLESVTAAASGGITLAEPPKLADGIVSVSYGSNTELLRKTCKVTLTGVRTDGKGNYSKDFLLVQAAANEETLPPRIELNLTGVISLLPGNVVSVFCTVFRGWTDKTSSVSAWAITRDTGDAEADAAWALLDKAKDFAGSITLENTESASDLGSDGTSALFTVTATMADGQTATKSFMCVPSSGVASFKSFVFRRSETAPDTPEGGSYSDPEPETEGWSDGVPAGEFQLWMSTRIFTYTGEPPQQEAWTTPAAVTDTADIDLEFSAVESGPGDPTSDPDNWHNDAAEDDIWMAVRKITNGVPGEWAVAKIKGEKGDKGNKGDKGADGKTLYTWIRYADDASGSGISDSPVASDGTLKKYIGFAYGKETATESNDPGDYKWALFKGTDGTDGIPGEPGADGQTLYTWIKYADSLGPYGYPTSMYDTPTADTQYIGIATNKTTSTEGSEASAYTWSKFKGDQGVPGKDGDKGDKGEQGDNGLSYRYSQWVSGVEYRNDNNPYYRDSDGRGIIDVVLTDSIVIYDPSSGDTPPAAYICKKTHTSSASIPLAEGEYWSKANSMAPILSALVLAHTIKADSIDVRDLTADSAFIDYLRVKRLLAGIEDGQRVEILPENRSVDIYDSSGDLVSTFEGNNYTDIDSLFGGGSGNLTITAPAGSQEADSSSWGEGQTVALSAATQTSVPAKFTVPSGVVTLTLSADESSVWSNNFCGCVFVQMSVYSDSGCSSKIGTFRLAALKMIGTGSKSVNLTGLSCNVATAGWVRMELFLKCFVYEGKTVSGAAANVGWSGLTTVAYSGSFYVARYFANGLVIGSGKNNYICIYRNPNGEMAFNMRGSGLDMHLSNINGLLVRKSTVAGTYRWMNILGKDTVGMPLNVLAIGEIYTSSSTAWISSSRTCDSNTLSASRVATGQYKVTMPTAWGTDYYVYLTTYGRNTKDVPRFASVYSQASGYFYVDVKDANGSWSDDCKIRFMIVKYGDFGGSHYNPTL